MLDTNYKGVIIEESLEDKKALENTKIISKQIEKVTEKHKTPWVKQWTLHTVEVPEKEIVSFSRKISKALDSEHNWYADLKNKKYHYIIFRNKVFKVDRTKPKEYDKVKKYGISLGIPEYQLDFKPNIK